MDILTTPSVISTMNILLSSCRYDDFEGKREILKKAVTKYTLTPEFIEEFKRYLTPDMIMSSRKIRRDVIEKYPELFDRDIFAGRLRGLLNSDGTSEGLKPENLSVYLLYLVISQVREELSLSPDLLAYVIRNDNKEEIKMEYVKALIGIDPECDALFMLRMPEAEKVKLIEVMKNENSLVLSSELSRFVDIDDSFDTIDSELSIKSFINLLLQSQDNGKFFEKIDQACKGDIKLTKEVDADDTEIKKFLTRIPEDRVVEIIKAIREKIFPNIISYNTLSWLFGKKEFSEEQMIEIKPEIMRNGMFFETKKYAEMRNYDRFLSE